MTNNPLKQTIFRKVPAIKHEGLMAKPMSRPMRPQVHFDFKTLPEAKDWEVGKTYKVALELKQVGTYSREGIEGGENGNSDFEIMGIKVL